ncbi:MAG: hypothetical protein LUE64_07065 [Candidatus Gastranaerophilales bacterium]|nr:hypothetical protein [Candidatus Gastranaerophilales bacterium]
MAQQFNSKQKSKVALIIFVKGSIAPIVLYLDEPNKVYENVQGIIRSPQPPKFFEIEANGPIKKVTFVTAEVTGCALQEEILFGK